MIRIEKNYWLKSEPKSNTPGPMLNSTDFWESLLQPVLISPENTPTVIEILAVARIFSDQIEQLFQPVLNEASYSEWVMQNLTIPPVADEQSHLVIGWQPLMRKEGILEWYVSGILSNEMLSYDTSRYSLTLSEDWGIECLLDLPVSLDPNYSVYNSNGMEIFFTRKSFTLLDFLSSLFETVLLFDGPNERSTYINLARDLLRQRFESGIAPSTISR